MPHKVNRPWSVVRARRATLALLLAFASVLPLASCAGLTGGPSSRPSQGRQAGPGLAPLEVNRPLMPGSERVDIALAPRHPRAPLVMMAISGGGSRSAYYAACVMEQLAATPAPDGSGLSMLDSVRCISTVSAGSLAAAWYALHYDQRNQPDFFPRFKKAMAVNLQWRTYGHMVTFPPLALQLLASSVTRTDLLAGSIDRLMGGGWTFDDLRAMETRDVDPAPVLIINGTVYNTGQRLVMTNLPNSRFPSVLDIEGPSPQVVAAGDARALAQLVQPLTFADIGSDIGSFGLGQAIATSAAFPIALAPVRLRIFPEHIPDPVRGNRIDTALLESRYLYVADGGVYENNGIDPLLSLVRTVPRRQPVLVIVVDASQRLETMRIGKHRVFDPITVIYRMYDIGTLRPLALYGAVLKQYRDTSNTAAVMVRMESSNPERGRLLRNIPTSFKLSDDHRDVLEDSARENFSDMLPALDAAWRRVAGGGKKR